MMSGIHRRALLTAVAAVSLTLSLNVGASYAQSGDKVTLKLANSQWLDALRGKNLWNAMLKYQQVNPNVTLEQEAIPASEFDDKITTEMGAGQGPDIAMMQEGLFYSIADAGFLVPLDNAVAGVNLNKTNENGVIDGTRYGVAWQRAVYALIYNKAILDTAKAEVPKTIDDLIASAKTVSGATPGVIGFTARHQMNDFKGWFMDFQNWAYGYGVNWVDADGKLTIDTPEAAAAVAAFKKVYDSGIVPVGDSMPTQRTRFKEKHVAFSIDNSGGTLNIASGGALPSADVGAAPLPFTHPGAHQQIFVGVSSHSEHQEEALAFVKWLVGPDGQKALRGASGPDALATDVPVDEAFSNANPWVPEFAKLAETSRSTLIKGHEVETPQIMRFVMQAVEKVLLTNTDPKTALAEAQKSVDTQF
ncbi:ABC transporter substrate-binding protein [Rhizobium sp. CF142]|uniref:ABC transporter substrate-binding protein n=1 Tax=Rhizobium sp. CF142 TaxID=1144314 RepID=UPI00026EF5B8|nr:extracellular solute-binding protein [Rhizobium sp. CF142]EJJ31454.1 ABC-type sugar transport system, periplasmic component [Rhizobium sp. CF142]